ncbi:hypothetical protein HanXRQr2_Chr02g0053771 [Helianthus annuus]|uniref:Uncharacterized protein n=1 Tax=Helianthus annuus TaxID=4232 RepID=A0A251UM43_HELAN|nr:hypothetical protein HanXRQr2_Chr02g0053771 [Helianthus annuus]KAJ0950837.1 hypothetical protein HanPSC8_Chr02g0052851 [Helianthus annuus]
MRIRFCVSVHCSFSFGSSFGSFRLTRRFFLRVRRRRQEQPEPIASPEPNGDHHRNLFDSFRSRNRNHS